jgi:hypothetical protein
MFFAFVYLQRVYNNAVPLTPPPIIITSCFIFRQVYRKIIIEKILWEVLPEIMPQENLNFRKNPEML